MNHPRVALRAVPLSVAETIEAVAHSEAGAQCLFVGVVRATNNGHTVITLEYQAYATMAEAEMARIVMDLETGSPGVRLAVHHRVGTLAVGDTAVVCAASAAHRDEAFRACRSLIDAIKARVPIWKRETWSGGTDWSLCSDELDPAGRDQADMR